jgi:hypothetical protein
VNIGLIEAVNVDIRRKAIKVAKVLFLFNFIFSFPFVLFERKHQKLINLMLASKKGSRSTIVYMLVLLIKGT